MVAHTPLHYILDWTDVEFGIRPMDLLVEPLDLRLACLFKADIEGWESIASALTDTLTETQLDGLAYHAVATHASDEDMLNEAMAVVRRRLKVDPPCWFCSNRTSRTDPEDQRTPSCCPSHDEPS